MPLVGEPSVRPAFLVVDDEPTVCSSIARTLVLFGDVTTAATVAEARSVISSRTPWQGLIFDVRLPDGSGFVLLDWARRHAPRAAAIIMTGQPELEFVNQAFERDADLVLKPIRPRWIRRFAQRAAARARDEKLPA